MRKDRWGYRVVPVLKGKHIQTFIDADLARRLTVLSITLNIPVRELYLDAIKDFVEYLENQLKGEIKHD